MKAVLSRLLLSSLLLSFSFCFKHLEISPVLKRRADGNSSFDLAFPERTRGHPSCLTHLATPDLQGACSVASGHFSLDQSHCHCLPLPLPQPPATLSLFQHQNVCYICLSPFYCPFQYVWQKIPASQSPALFALGEVMWEVCLSSLEPMQS